MKPEAGLEEACAAYVPSGRLSLSKIYSKGIDNMSNYSEYLFELTEDQKAIVDQVRLVAAKELAPIVAEQDVKGDLPIEVVRKFQELGLYGMNIPEEYGGMGIDRKTWMLVVEELSKVDAGFAFSFMVPGGHFRLFSIACQDETKRQKFADEILSGKFVSFCLTEPEAGSDAAAVRTTAVYDAATDEYIINGSKCFITNGGFASYFITAAMTDMGDGKKKISLFLVEKERGVQVGKEENKMGLRLSNTTEVVFDEVRVPADHLLGEKGKGLSYCLQYMEQVRGMDAAFAVGIAQSALNYAVDYAKTRKTMGKPIIQHQAVGSLLANMRTKVDAMQCVVTQCAERIDAGLPLGTLASSSKLFCSESAVEVADMAIQVLGGYGYMKDYPVEKLLRDARIFPIFEGTNEIVRTVSTGMMMK